MSSLISGTSSSSSSSSSSTSTVQNGHYWGLASGLDVDSIVTGLLTGQQSKIDKANQQKQTLEWKQSAYQNITGSINTFMGTYLDILGTGSILSSKAFSTYGAASDSSAVSATATTDAVFGSHTVTVYQNAAAAKIQGNIAGVSISGSLTAAQTTSAELHASLDGTSFNITVDGITQKISFDSSDTYTDRSSLQTAIEDKSTAAIGMDKVAVSIDDSGNVTFSSKSPYTSAVSVSSPGDSITGTASFSSILASSTMTTDDKNTAMGAIFNGTSFDMTVNGNKQTISFTADDMTNADHNYSNFADLIQSKLDTAFGTGAVKATLNSSGQISFSPGTNTSSVISVTGGSGTSALQKLGIADGANIADSLTALGIKDGASNRVSMSSTLQDAFGSTFAAGTGGVFDVKINGVDISLSTTDTVQSAINKINSSKAGVTVTYAQSTGQFSISSSSTGASAKISLDDSYTAADNTTASRGFFSALLGGVTDTTAQGRDAVFDFDSNRFTRDSNSFQIDGLNITINSEVTLSDTPLKTANITMTNDVSSAVKSVTDFVNAYNTLLSSIYTQVTAKPDSDYQPLTDAQKKEMSDTDITNWNTKAQQGLLFSDSTLQNILDNMQDVISQSVTTSSGKTISLYDIGISTVSDYTKGGQLQIDTDKLTQALENDPKSVQELFTKSSGTYYDIAGGSSQTQRMKEEGIGYKLQDVLNNAVKTGVYPNVGSLIAIAGTSSDTNTDYELNKELSDLNSKITEYEQQMTDKKNQLYNQFSQLETFMEKINEQSSMISSLGSGS